MRGKPIFLVPVLEAMKVEALPFPATIFSYDDEVGPAAACAQALGELQSRLALARREGVYKPCLLYTSLTLLAFTVGTLAWLSWRRRSWTILMALSLIHI